MLNYRKFGKQLTALLLAAIMTLGLSACGGNETDDKTTTPSADTTAPAEDTTKAPDQPVEDEKNLVLYVSPDGDDETGNPYKSLEGVKNAIRAIDKTNLESITVRFKEGHYETYGVKFTEEDSGTETCKILYTTYEDEEAILGAQTVIPTSAFHKLEDEALLARLTGDAKEKVLELNMADIGLSLEECIEFYNTHGSIKRASMFVNGVRQTIARYPDNEYLQGGGLKKINDEERRFKVTSDEDLMRFDSWVKNGDIWMFGFWKYDWSDSYHRLENVDVENKLVTMETAHHYGYSRKCHHYYLNIFEELTMPGEYFIDWQNGKAYYYPGENFDKATVTLSMTDTSIIDMAHAEYLEFNGLIFEGSQAKAVDGDMNNVTFDSCVFRNVASYGVWVSGNNLKFLNCEFAYLGGSGIDINGGDFATLTSSGNVIDNCCFHDYGQIEHISYGVWLRGVGGVVSHNEMYNCPHGGIRFYGNEHIMEYNEFHHLEYETDDGGVVYCGRHFDYYGNIIRYNYFHDILSIYQWTVNNEYAPRFIYEDDGLCGTSIIGNLFVGYEGGHSGVKMQGMDSVAKNNIFVYNNSSIDYAGAQYFEDSNSENDEFLRQSCFMSDVWIEKYPEMDKYRHGRMTGFPQTIEEMGVTIINTLQFEPDDHYDSEEPFQNMRFNSMLDGVSIQRNNVTYPMSSAKDFFVDPDHGDYTIKADAPCMAWEEFEPIPFAEMGRRYEE